ncbi:MAG: citrate synthase [Planctomycetes bacterium]|nr:citrate synthase [Planctomycetota bacterium]
MTDKAKLELNGKPIEVPVIVGTEDEHAIDISELRAKTGFITLDDGYGNTGSCKSAITYIDGEKGILRYRGIPIEQLAAKSSFLETAWLVIWGELPTRAQLDGFTALVLENARLHENLLRHFESFPANGHPMAELSAMINTVSCYELDIMNGEDAKNIESAAARLLGKVCTIAAASYNAAQGKPIIQPDPALGYADNFLQMMFSQGRKDYRVDHEVAAALDLIFVLHADHEQNCSTSTVRMVASSGANLFASCAAGVCALWGPLHGGANAAVLDQLESIHKSGVTVKDYIARAKDKTSGVRLMGFGHRVYKNYDPRAKIIKATADRILDKLHINDPLLDIARELEAAALADSYFKDRSLYPNVDFYSGIIMRAIGIPVNMFTVMFAIGRMPGWIAHWKELHDQKSRIYRPRQVYIGKPIRDYVAMESR